MKESTVGVAEGRQGPGGSGRTEVTHGEEGVFVEGFGGGVDDVGGADHGGDVEHRADQYRWRGRNMAPAISF